MTPRLSIGARGYAIGIAGLAGALFLWQLGSSSFFIDEALTMKSADGPLGRLWTEVRLGENNPPTYYLLVHGVLKLLGSDREWAARLPSALAGVALVVAVWRLGTLVAGREAGYVAGVLAVTSPLILQYSQQARTYALAMVAVAIAAIAVLETGRRSSWAWTGAACAFCALALSLHYFTILVVAPLAGWLLMRRRVALWQRLAVSGSVALCLLAWLPLAVQQATDNRQAELGPYGTLTASHAVAVIGAPLSGRHARDVSTLQVAAALVIGAALLWAATRPDRPELRLMALTALGSAAALLVAALLGKELFNPRYMTFAVPLLLVAVAAAISESRRVVAAVAVAVLAATGVVGIVESHRRSGFYPDARGATAAIERGWRPGDAVLAYASLGTTYPLEYYVRKRLPLGTGVAPLEGRANGKRLWIVRDEPVGLSGALPQGYHAVRVWRFSGVVAISLTLAARAQPRSSPAARGSPRAGRPSAT